MRAYEFWAEKTRARINDLKKGILAPLLKNQPHPFGTQRPSLEQRYYEVYKQGNVDIIALKQNPIETFTETGIKMKNGDKHQFDIIILATGFDLVTGGLCQIDIKGTDGVLLRDKWAKGTPYADLPWNGGREFPESFFPSTAPKPQSRLRTLRLLSSYKGTGSLKPWTIVPRTIRRPLIHGTI
jgi:cation diffusion facilitator CzcD-associated flavoprotein CzcO